MTLLRCSIPFLVEGAWGEAKGSKSIWGVAVGVEEALKTILDVSFYMEASSACSGS